MDQQKRTKKGKKLPRVPIKTYRWEDIRRSRRRGGYPWTHLYKNPFNEQLDPEPFKMNSLPRSKSNSTIEHSEGVQISDVTGHEEGERRMDSLQIVTEPDSETSARNSIGSIVIEECDVSDIGEADNHKPETVALESADSSDNISQYLDKEDMGPEKVPELKKLSTTDEDIEDETEKDGSKNLTAEEQSQRKRKMSAESSYSRISLTKQAVLKKFKDTKNKIKVPKLTFPVNKLKRLTPKSAKNISSETKKDAKSTQSETKKDSKSVSSEPKKGGKKQSAQPKDVKPVYIHIPLKPPPGQTDEFSYLEFEENPPIGTTSITAASSATDIPTTATDIAAAATTTPTKPQVKGVGSFKFLAKNIKRLQETQPNNEQVLHEETPSKDLKDDTPLNEKDELKKEEENEKTQENINLESNVVETKSTIVENDSPKDIEICNEEKDKLTSTTDAIVTEDLNSNVEESASPVEEDLDKKGILKKSADVTEQSSTQPPKGILKGRQGRAKSEEPERKRKLSLESSYSRKSLSKLEFMKRLKETSDKIKKTFSSKRNKKQSDLEKTPAVKESRPEKRKKQEKTENVKPVYIHIPLKPPEGEKLPEEESSQPSNSPDSPVTNDVHLIILTAPSDDEVLDDHSSDVPETPSSDNKTFFDTKIDELKKLAKDVVNDVTLPKLDPVTEETTNGNKSDTEVADASTTVQHTDKLPAEQIPSSSDDNNIKVQDTKTETEDTKTETEKTIPITPDGANVTIDVEDGLSESRITENKLEPSVEPQPVLTDSAEGTPSDIKLNLESIPTIKKKVSFKRRSKSSKDDSYEEIVPRDLTEVSGDNDGQQELKEVPSSEVEQLPSDDKQLDQSIMASPKEDEDKWSRISDHEYEPVNPPPEVQTIFSSIPTLNVTQESSNSQLDDGQLDVPNIKDLPVDGEGKNKTEPLFFAERKADTNISTQAEQIDDQQQHQDISTDKNKDPNKFQLAWKQTTNQFKNKIRNLKKPHTSEEDKPKSRKFKFEKPNFEKPKFEKIKFEKIKFEKPKFEKLKFEKPKFNLPKMPDTSKINLPSLPSFNLPRRNSTKRSLKERQQSTESNAGDSKKMIFDFSTYPRVFKKKVKPKSETKQEEFLDLASVPHPTKQETKITTTWSDSDGTRIPLHSEQSVSDDNMETLNELGPHILEKNDDKDEYIDEDDRMASHIRYKDDIDIDDEFDENQDINNDDYLSRWNRGNFNPDLDADYTKQFENSRYEVTDLDFPEDMDQQTDFNSNQNKERYSSGSSFGGQRFGGVLEEINPDEFFLRKKGISQDNIEVGLYLSSEIKEAFRTPENALSKMEDRDFNIDISNQSLPEVQPKRKPVRKPKRKKTPHVSQEQISHGESDDEDINVTPPSRPKRRSKRIQKPKYFEDVIPYQETIPVETNVSADIPFEQEHPHILSNYERNMEINGNHGIENRRQEFNVANVDDFEYIDDNKIEKPAAPPRKHKSLKSLTSENDSILEEINSQIQTPGSDIDANRTGPDFTSTTYPLERPSRKKSRSSLQSGTSLQSKELPQKEEEYLSSSSQILTSENQTPCIEEPCIKDIRDYMGYAIIDKQKIRDPPLPPPRSPARKKRSTKQTESDFFTVPRQSKYDNSTPVRPLRNYSTLGQTRKSSEPATYENKENIDIIQYIEIEDEPNRNLQSGDIIKKMKDRPLPAPPRPPRKSRVLQNITSKENIMAEFDESIGDETPPPDEELKEYDEQSLSKTANVTEPAEIVQDDEKCIVEKRLITPDYFTHQETITHGSLLIQSLDGDKILPDSELTHRSQERIIPISKESDDETSSVPEEFKNLKDPPHEPAREVTSPVSTDVEVPKTHKPHVIDLASLANTEVDILKAHKLQIVDLDVDTLTVNKLLAGKIIVSEIDSHSIRTDEINTKLGAIHLADAPKTHQEGELEKSESFLSKNNVEDKQEDSPKEKKTSTDTTQGHVMNEPEAVLSEHEIDKISDNMSSPVLDIPREEAQDQTELLNEEGEYPQSDPPVPPPRSSAVHLESSSECFSSPPPQFEETAQTTSSYGVIQEPDVDDEPPPRPPQPHLDYIPSQPPASFYALRAQKYVDSVESNIPKVPRRKRPPRSISRSSSEDSLVAPVSRRVYSRSPEPSISQLSGQLVRTCGSTAHSALKRLISDITNNLKKNSDGKLDLHVMTIILLILIAGLILLGYGDEKTVVHLHHWEYFNPPRDL